MKHKVHPLHRMHPASGEISRLRRLAGLNHTDTNLLATESEMGWRRRSRRPQIFEKPGACFSKTLASRIQTRLNATWYEGFAACDAENSCP
jgi:hypothetical protein